jgi:phosphatidylinositol-3-phosphatase
MDRVPSGFARNVALVLAAIACLAVVPAPASAGVPQIKHLFVIVLENENAEESFGEDPPSPYLGAKLPADGAFVPNYFGIGHASLDNYIAMISGQPPNLVTQADCPVFSEMTPGTLGPDGVAAGQGCVFPAAVKTVANQLEDEGDTWRGYMEDMASGAAAGEPATCRHPAIGQPDRTQAARAGDQYATRHNPFVYFHAVIDSPACERNVVDLSRLPQDLERLASSPEYAFITPDLCADGHDENCADPSVAGGYAGIEAFLKEWIPQIEGSLAYQDKGMILITFDESASTADSCCGETTGPNTANNGGSRPGSGGGRVGAVMVSPCIQPGTVSSTAYNHYSMLRWVEDNFGLAHLANASPSVVGAFGADILNRPDCRRKAKLKVRPRKATAGKKKVFHFRLFTDLPACKEGATIELGKRRAKTDRSGRAHLTIRLRHPGRLIARATPRICEPAKAPVRVRPAG